jgi:hypothetical protein
LAVALLVCGIGFASQTAVIEVGSHQPQRELDRAAYVQEQQRLLDWLVDEQVEEGLEAAISIFLSETEIHDIEMGRCTGCESAPRAMLAGMVKPVDAAFEVTGATHGAMARTADGGLVWSAAVHSSSAKGLRVHFTEFSLPEGFELWLYSMDGGVRGPYTARGPNGSGDFWSHTVAGPDAVIQLRGYGSEAVTKDASFVIADVGHVGRGAGLKAFCSFNADCIENGECFNVSSVADAKEGVAHMQYIKRPYIYFCSGGLLNDTSESGTPYFLTANHCISRDREAGTLEAFFLFTIPCGSTACPGYNEITADSTLGATVLATNKTSDFTLLRLSQNPPAGTTFLGWTNVDQVGSGADLFRISHPGGAPQAYSKHTEWVPPVVCSSWPRGPWIYTQDQIGATEGGSSGSPVVNADGQVVGQLSGGCGFNVNDNCDSVNNSTVDGALAAYFDQVAPWLAPGAGCADGDNDGYEDEACGGSDCDDANPFVNPGATEVCDDEIDNDCNGLTDLFDPACGGSSCQPEGAPCTTGDDCCSGSCHPRRLICR